MVRFLPQVRSENEENEIAHGDFRIGVAVGNGFTRARSEMTGR